MNVVVMIRQVAVAQWLSEIKRLANLTNQLDKINYDRKSLIEEVQWDKVIYII